MTATLHPQTAAAWARAIFGAPAKAQPYDAKARAAARCDRTWDEIERKIAGTPGSSVWEYEIAVGAVELAREREERARQEAVLAEIRERSRREGGATVEDRARAWLGYRSGESSAQAFAACVGLVRGFCLGESEALVLLEQEYAPRFHRALPRPELLGMVRRAARASKPMGYLLTEERRAG